MTQSHHISQPEYSEEYYTMPRIILQTAVVLQDYVLRGRGSKASKTEAVKDSLIKLILWLQ